MAKSKPEQPADGTIQELKAIGEEVAAAAEVGAVVDPPATDSLIIENPTEADVSREISPAEAVQLLVDDFNDSEQEFRRCVDLTERAAVILDAIVEDTSESQKLLFALRERVAKYAGVR